MDEILFKLELLVWWYLMPSLFLDPSWNNYINRHRVAMCLVLLGNTTSWFRCTPAGASSLLIRRGGHRDGIGGFLN